MKSKSMLLLGLAIGCGLVAAFLTVKLGASTKSDSIQVLVAAKNIDQGTKLEKPEELFVRKPFPKDSAPPDFLDDLNALRGKVLQRTLRAGSHLTIEDITPVTEVDLPIDEKTGQPYMAMGIRVNTESAAGGLIKPGSRVDVVCVERLPNGKSAATIILQFVLVVSVNDKIKQGEYENPVVKNVSNVTVAVKQQEGALLALAAKRGELSLMLRDKQNKSITSRVRTIDSLGASDRLDETGQLTVPEYPSVPIARKTIPAGTKITDPNDWFEEKKVLEMPRNAIVKLDDLKGKTVTRDIFENSWAAIEAFEGEVAKKGESTGAVDKMHTVGIQVGSNAPTYFTYRNGQLESNNEKTVKTPTRSNPEPGEDASKPTRTPAEPGGTPTEEKDRKPDEGK